NIRDRIDEHFISYTRDVPEDEVELIPVNILSQEVEENSWSSFIRQVRDFSDYNDPGFFDFLQENIDVQNMIDYFLIRIYISSVDWPGNNRSVWRHKSDTGRFRNILFDNDNTLDIYEANTLRMALEEDGPSWPNPEWSTLLLRSALLNDTFRDLFIERNEELVVSLFNEERLMGILDSLVGLYEPLMPDHINRWQFPGENISAWYFHVKNMRKFFEKRPCVIRAFFREYFNLPENYLSSLGCESNSLVSESDESTLVIELFPNPTNSAITIAAMINPNTETRLMIFDAQGRKLIEESIIEESRFFVRYISEIANWSPGVYLVRFENLGRVVNQRFIIN
ncbi:MAG: T9SS C-terminal target domain-containing protein, partial [Flavobacteriales bacterium]